MMMIWAVSAGDHLHLLHVIPVPAPEMLSGTSMNMAGGDFVLAEPDPAADKAEVCLLSLSFWCCVASCVAFVNSCPIPLIDS